MPCSNRDLPSPRERPVGSHSSTTSRLGAWGARYRIRGLPKPIGGCPPWGGGGLRCGNRDLRFSRVCAVSGSRSSTGSRHRAWQACEGWLLGGGHFGGIRHVWWWWGRVGMRAVPVELWGSCRVLVSPYDFSVGSRESVGAGFEGHIYGPC